MSRAPARHAAALVVMVVACMATRAEGQMTMPTGRETLRGLGGVEVLVEDVPPVLTRAGLTQGRIETDVKRQVTSAGITVYPSQRANPSPAQPYLYIHLNALPASPAGDLSVALQVHVRQTMASLVAPARVVNAMTWDAHTIVAVPTGRAADLMTEIHAQVARFINDWNAVH